MRSMTLTLLAAILLAAAPARADILMWNLVAECQPGAGEVKVTSSFSTGVEGTAPQLWACGGGCTDMRALATPVTWVHKQTQCTCFPSGTTPEPDCPQGEYAKCTEVHETTLPYACDALAYTRICVSEKCNIDEPTWMGDAPCAALQPAATANGCLDPVKQVEPMQIMPDPPVGPEADEAAGGCSISAGAANASLLALLLVAAALGLVLSRRRK
jgi:hypothetical protein